MSEAPPAGRVLRVGITGHRDIASRYRATEAGIRHSLATLFARIRDLARPPALVCDAAPAPIALRIVSPLADGADRLAAAAGRAAGYRLLAPLPFVQAEYEQDFDLPSRAAFRHLLAYAAAEDGVVTLAGTRRDLEASYLAVGQYVVAHADLLIALWDPTRPILAGGTGAIVAWARARAVPVLWIAPDAPERVSYLDPDHEAVPLAEAEGALRAYLSGRIGALDMGGGIAGVADGAAPVARGG